MALRRSNSPPATEPTQYKSRVRKLGSPARRCAGRVLFLEDLIAIRSPSVDLGVLTKAGFEILHLSAKNFRGSSVADCAQEAADAVRIVGWSSCHVIGCGFGGMIAQLLATEYVELRALT